MAEPLFAQLASAPSAQADAAKAAMYCRSESSVRGGMTFAPDGEPAFWFKRDDGSVDWFTTLELRAQTWWYWLPEPVALSVEAHLFPLPQPTAEVHFVARTDIAAGQTLVSGSRLSSYFEGEGGETAARQECLRLGEKHPDAAVFSASNHEEAERLLAAEDAVPFGS